MNRTQKGQFQDKKKHALLGCLFLKKLGLASLRISWGFFNQM